jgi:hypothetical protein
MDSNNDIFFRSEKRFGLWSIYSSFRDLSLVFGQLGSIMMILVDDLHELSDQRDFFHHWVGSRSNADLGI